MFCTNCGKNVKDDSNFCEYCGASLIPITENLAEQQTEPVKAASIPTNTVPATRTQNSNKKKNNMMIPLIVAAVLVIAVIAIAVTKPFAPKEVPPVTPQPSKEQYQKEQDSHQQENKKDEILYKAKNLEELNVRKGPSTSYDIVRVIKTKGSILSVYEEKKSAEYTWLRIGENEWVANNGSWLIEVGSDKNLAEDPTDQYVRSLVELNVRSGSSTSAKILGVAKKNSTFNVYDRKNDGTYIWCCIGTNMWIADDGSYLVEISEQEYKKSSGIIWK